MAVDKNMIEAEASVLRFYRIVLSWDYLRLLKESDNHKYIKTENNTLGLKEVKNTYKDVDDYFSTFEPLLFEEVKANIIQRKDDQNNLWTAGIITECSEVNEFNMPMVLWGDSESDNVEIRQNDLLLLSNKAFKMDKELPSAYAFALVEHCQHKKIKLRMFLNGEITRYDTDEVKPCSRLFNMRPLVNEVQKILHILKICSLSTIVREYVALRSISSLPFKDLVLTAKEEKKDAENHAWKISKPLMEFIETNHNPSQLLAIKAGLSRDPFILIQGPPGTGKTQTILGILSAILHATPARVHGNQEKVSGVKRRPESSLHEKYNHWGKASPWLCGTNPRDEVMPKNGDDGFFPTSGNELKPEVVNSSRKYRVRVLVCAPSNSALDEIIIRILKTGIRDENARAYNPKIVRIGIKPHHSVQEVSMDYLVKQKRASVNTQSGDKQKQGRGGKDDDDSDRASVLAEAVIVFSTLSFSGSPLFSKLNHGFDVVIIDEAAQAVESATLVPLANGCKQVFLVGDPVQLPATVISPIAGKFRYDTSLFERFKKAGYPVKMLDTQYRMHKKISIFPSKEFYEGKLKNAKDVKVQTIRSWHAYRCFGPFCFFDIHEGNESQPSGSGGSYVNVDEVDFVLAIYHELVTRYPELKSSARFAIITPYKSQRVLIEERFQETFGVEPDKVVDINTVDGFQGREKDVAIFSCVRANKDKGIGFVKDFRRMNVGITRARSSILVVGSASTLKTDPHWKNLVESAENTNALFQVSKPYADYFSEENLKLLVAPQEKPKGPHDNDMDVDVDVDATVVDADQGAQAEDIEDGDGEAEEDNFDED